MRAKIIRKISYTELEIRINELEKEDCEIIDIRFTIYTEKSMSTGEDMIVYYALILYD